MVLSLFRDFQRAGHAPSAWCQSFAGFDKSAVLRIPGFILMFCLCDSTVFPPQPQGLGNAPVLFAGAAEVNCSKLSVG